MTDKFRKQDAVLPSLKELLGERSEIDEEDEAANDTAEQIVAMSVLAEEAEAPPAAEEPAAGRRSDTAWESPSPSSGGEGGGLREAFEQNWYRVLAAQAKVRATEGSEAEADESDDGSR